MQTLFRGNSLASKIMSYCFKIYGQGYLRELLNPLIMQMFYDNQQGVAYEVDPARLVVLDMWWLMCEEDEDDTCLVFLQVREWWEHWAEYGKPDAPHSESVWCYCGFIRKVALNSLSLSVSSKLYYHVCVCFRFQPKLSSMCHCLSQALIQRFPGSTLDAVWTVIGTVVFLRFLNPALGNYWNIIFVIVSFIILLHFVHFSFFSISLWIWYHRSATHSKDEARSDSNV